MNNLPYRDIDKNFCVEMCSIRRHVNYTGMGTYKRVTTVLLCGSVHEPHHHRLQDRNSIKQ